MPSNILITGVTGFLGSHLASRLVAQGEVVAGLKRPNSNLQRIADIQSQITLHNYASGVLAEIFKSRSIDVVIHAATCYGRSQETASTIYQANIDLPLRLLELSINHSVPVFLNIDTSLPAELNAYSLSKAHFRDWAELLTRSCTNLAFINLRFEHFFGPGNSKFNFITRVIQACLCNQPSLELTAGEQQRDFIYIDDAVSGLMMIVNRLADLPNGFQSYEIGSGTTISVHELVTHIHQISRSKTRLQFGAVPYRHNEIMHSVADVSFLKELGWSPQCNLQTALEKTINYEASIHKSFGA